MKILEDNNQMNLEYTTDDKLKVFIINNVSLKDNLDFLRKEIAKFYISDEFNELPMEQFLAYKQVMNEINEVYELMFMNKIEEIKIEHFKKSSILFSIFSAKIENDKIKKLYVKNKEQEIKEAHPNKRLESLRVRNRMLSRHKFLVNRKMSLEERVLFKYLSENEYLLEEDDLLGVMAEKGILEKAVKAIRYIARDKLISLYISSQNFDIFTQFIDVGTYDLIFDHKVLLTRFSSPFYQRLSSIKKDDEIKKYVLFERLLKEIKESKLYKYPILNKEEMEIIKSKLNSIVELKNSIFFYDKHSKNYTEKMLSASKKSEVAF